jgi:hypothetical protein
LSGDSNVGWTSASGCLFSAALIGTCGIYGATVFLNFLVKKCPPMLLGLIFFNPQWWKKKHMGGVVSNHQSCPGRPLVADPWKTFNA